MPDEFRINPSNGAELRKVCNEARNPLKGCPVKAKIKKAWVNFEMTLNYAFIWKVLPGYTQPLPKREALLVVFNLDAPFLKSL